MGTLLGHALPGSFFLLYAVWRLIQLVRRRQLLQHFRRPKDEEELFYTSASYPCYVGCFARWPVEGIFKVLLTSIGMCGELWASTEYGEADHIVHYGDIQHVTMYSMFFVSGVVDLAVWCCPMRHPDVSDHRPECCQRCCCPFPVPSGVDFVALSIAFIDEAVLFSQHLHGRNDFDKLLHHLLLYVLFGTVVSLFVECRQRRSLTAALTTVYFLIVQGAWFIQVGLLLYPPPETLHRSIQLWLYDLPDDDQTIMVTLIFSWHLAAAFIVLLFVYGVLTKLCPLICCCECAISDTPYREYKNFYDVECDIELDPVSALNYATNQL